MPTRGERVVTCRRSAPRPVRRVPRVWVRARPTRLGIDPPTRVGDSARRHCDGAVPYGRQGSTGDRRSGAARGPNVCEAPRRSRTPFERCGQRRALVHPDLHWRGACRVGGHTPAKTSSSRRSGLFPQPRASNVADDGLSLVARRGCRGGPFVGRDFDRDRGRSAGRRSRAPGGPRRFAQWCDGHGDRCRRHPAGEPPARRADDEQRDLRGAIHRIGQRCVRLSDRSVDRDRDARACALGGKSAMARDRRTLRRGHCGWRADVRSRCRRRPRGCAGVRGPDPHRSRASVFARDRCALGHGACQYRGARAH